MKYLDEYRDGEAAQKLLQTIRSTATKPWTLMEVCGGQTHGLLRYGIDEALRGLIELIHGPGCPVCVTPLEAIDFAQELAHRSNTILTSFGDMLRVPGSRQSLLDVRGSGGDVRIVYSPLDALEIARKNPDKEVVFFAVGFETTAPASALAALQAEQEQITNFSLLVSHVRVLPAMEKLMESDDCCVQGFLAAGHVCTVTGTNDYEAFVDKFQVPVVVTGFEPVDLLSGILSCVQQLESGTPIVENQYARSVRDSGNETAQDMINQVYEIADSNWRGMGIISKGGLRLRPTYSQFDAMNRFHQTQLNAQGESEHCRSADVMTGKIKPPDCPAFGTTCRPESPLGAPMVSTEGACAAYMRFSNFPRS